MKPLTGLLIALPVAMAVPAALAACTGDTGATTGSNACWDGSHGDPCPVQPNPDADAGPDADASSHDAHEDAQEDAHEIPDGGWVDSPSLSGLPEIPSNFDVTTVVGPAWGTGDIPGPYGDGIAEGAFRFLCEPGQLLYEDPIVYPGQPGASHLHQFFGNREANASSAFESLRTTGGSTCNWMKDANGDFLPIAANRSAYWVPALLDGTGNVVRPDYLTVYYKRHTTMNGCRPTGQAVPIGTCVPLPHGLRYIFGRSLANLAGTLDKGYEYRCEAPDTGHYANLEDVLAACPPGFRIIGWASAPSCWDGTHLDSPNHRDHMAYADWVPGEGTLQCPPTHPYLIPHFELGQVWNVDGLDPSKLQLSSDSAAPGEKRGSTYHADWWGAWDDGVMMTWNDNCIEKALDGSGGDLCNGTMLKGASQPSYGWSNPNRLVPVPARP
jgi:hypothetical protein